MKWTTKLPDRGEWWWIEITHQNGAVYRGTIRVEQADNTVYVTHGLDSYSRFLFDYQKIWREIHATVRFSDEPIPEPEEG